jgi:hypothetical protein
MKCTRRTVALVVIFVGLAARQLVAAPQTNAPGGPAVGSRQARAQATGTEPGAGSTPVPISVFSDPDGPAGTFLLQNTGSKAITAWHLAVGAGGDSGGLGVDAYRSFAGLIPDEAGTSRWGDVTYIAPGASIKVMAGITAGRGRGAAAGVMTPTCAVFDDRSFAGDAKFADFVFWRRGLERAAWSQITGELEKARARGVAGVPTLEAVLATIDGTSRNDGSDVVRQTVRTNITLAIMSVRAGESSAASRLDGFLDEACRSLAAATAHSRP